MRTLTIILLFATLIGCGDESGSNGAEESSKASNNDEGKNELLQSIALKSKNDLPDCEEANDTQLAYIKDEKKFYVCESDEWVETDIQGKDGEDGTDGQDGVDGADGDDATLSNVWIDPVSGDEWQIGGYGVWAGAYCGTGYSRPNMWDAQDAVAHGLLTASVSINGPNNVWTSTDSGANAKYIDVNNNATDANKGTTKGIFCKKD